MEQKENTKEKRSLSDIEQIPERSKADRIKEYKTVQTPARVIVEEQDEEDDVDISCGIWKFRTNIFGRWFSNLYVFTFFVGVASLFTYMVSEVIQVQLPSLERQFGIDNARAGLFDTAFKTGFLCTILFAGQITKKAHVPAVVGMSGIIQGFILMVPPILQFVDPYTLPPFSSSDNGTEQSENDKFLCRVSTLNNTLNDSTSITSTAEPRKVNHLAYIILIILQTLKGVTDVFHGMLLPTVYMDDNLKDKSRMGILLGIQSVFQMLASPLGREINGVLSEIPIDLKKTEMSPKDHRFVAAWWMGFLIFGLGTAFFSFIVLLFPRRLVSKRQQQLAAEQAMVTFSGGQAEEDVLPEQVPTPHQSRKISVVLSAPEAENPRTLMEVSLESPGLKRRFSAANVVQRRRSSLFPPVPGPTERKVSLIGDIVLDPPVTTETPASFLQLIKDLPVALYRIFRNPMFIMLIIGVCMESIPMGGVSFFRSTYMVNEYNIPMSRVAFLSGISTAVGNTCGAVASSWLSSRVTTKMGYVLLIFSTYLVATCMTPLYLVFGCDNQPIYGAPGDIGLPVNGSEICNCNNVGQLVSCGDDGNNYYSPCYAGCNNVHGNVFSNCSLLFTNQTSGTSLQPGICNSDCERNFLIYVVVHGLQFFVTTSSLIAYKLLVLRSVEPRDRGFGISVYIFFYFLMGIPAPNLFGRVVDSYCNIKDGDTCVLYDRDKIRYLMSGIDVVMYGSSQLMAVFMMCFLKWEKSKTIKQAQQPEVPVNFSSDSMTDGQLQRGAKEQLANNVQTNLDSTHSVTTAL